MDGQIRNQVGFFANVLEVKDFLTRAYGERRVPSAELMQKTNLLYYKGKSMLEVIWSEGRPGVERIKTCEARLANSIGEFNG